MAGGASKGFRPWRGWGWRASKIVTYEDSRRIDKVGHLIYPDGPERGHGRVRVSASTTGAKKHCGRMDARRCTGGRCSREIGGFDEDFFAYADDAELGLRARIAGWKCWYMPQAVVRHRRGETLGVRSAERRAAGLRGTGCCWRRSCSPGACCG